MKLSGFICKSVFTLHFALSFDGLMRMQSARPGSLLLRLARATGRRIYKRRLRAELLVIIACRNEERAKSAVAKTRLGNISYELLDGVIGPAVAKRQNRLGSSDTSSAQLAELTTKVKCGNVSGKYVDRGGKSKNLQNCLTAKTIGGIYGIRAACLLA
ncbi:MAG: hypothetical protein LBU32_01490 [Clostridiales bacterium]|jgi:hypothetical protein|nr:hypothetical protein [Clostridiales bacterium]